MIRTIALIATIGALLAAPAIALGCSIAVQQVGTRPATQAEIAVPVRHASTRSAWKLHRSWLSERPQLIQSVPVVGSSRYGVQGKASLLRRHDDSRRAATLLATVTYLQTRAVDDSLHVLDVLYDRDGGQKPQMIATDTASYSDIVFGLLTLAGYTYAPARGPA